MPSRRTGTLIFGCVVAVSISIVAIGAGSAGNHADRERAAAQAEKERKLGPFKTAPLFKHTEKLRGPLKVQIENLGTSIGKGEVFRLRGNITTHHTLERQTEFTWVLPEGVELVSGQVSGTAWVTPDQPLALELIFKKSGDDEMNAQIHLVTSSTRGGASFSDTAQFNTNLNSNTGTDKNSGVTASGLNKAAAQKKDAPPVKIFY
jgi:hypothetical protein